MPIGELALMEFRVVFEPQGNEYFFLLSEQDQVYMRGGYELTVNVVHLRVDRQIYGYIERCIYVGRFYI